MCHSVTFDVGCHSNDTSQRFNDLKSREAGKLLKMGVFSRFIAVVTCRSCTTVDEKVSNFYFEKKK